MTRPYQRWNELWNFFMALDQDWWDYFKDEEAALADELDASTTDRIETSLVEWHEAFDEATDDEVSNIVQDFNTAYDPAIEFGGYRGWADWVREHLEAELARRKADLSDAGDPV